MAVKSMGLVAIGAVAGYVASAISHPDVPARGDSHSTPVVVHSPEPHSAAPEASPPALSPAEQQRKIEEIQARALRNALARRSTSNAAGGVASESLRQTRQAQLQASGLSQQRFDQITMLRDELLVKQARAAEEQMRSGAPPDPFGARYQYHPDLDLRDSIGAEEYTIFLQAVGRPTTVGVPEVPEGSLAALAGLQPGDEIVTYGGKRVFNFHDLQMVAAAGPQGSNVLVEVRRDGRLLQLSMPRGSVGLRAETTWETGRRLLSGR